MRYGREYEPIDPSAVETPEANVNTFISKVDNLLYGKFPDGSVKLLSAGGSANLASQGTNTGTADAVVVDIDGVVAYNNGDYYFIFMPEANTGVPMTIDITGVGVKNIKFGGNANLDLPAGKIMANTVNAFIYDGVAFQFIGMVDGDKVAFEAEIAVEAYQAIGGGATVNLDIPFPVFSDVKVMVVKALDVANEFAGGASTAVSITATDVGSAADYFGGVVDVFTGATAAGRGGWSTGVGKIAGVIPSTVGPQTKRFALTVTTDVVANLTQGKVLIQTHWDLVPW